MVAFEQEIGRLDVAVDKVVRMNVLESVYLCGANQSNDKIRSKSEPLTYHLACQGDEVTRSKPFRPLQRFVNVTT